MQVMRDCTNRQIGDSTKLAGCWKRKFRSKEHGLAFQQREVLALLVAGYSSAVEGELH